MLIQSNFNFQPAIFTRYLQFQNFFLTISQRSAMKKFGFKKVYLFFSSAFIFVIHIPFVFAKTNPMGKLFFDKPGAPPVTLTDTSLVKEDSNGSFKFSLYDSLRLGSLGLGRQVFDL